MNIVIAMEHHFRRTPDGAFWSPTIFSHAYFQRYLSVFDHLRIVARVQAVQAPEQQWVRSDGPHVSVLALPDYYGPTQYLQQRRALRQRTQAAVTLGDAVILDNGSIGFLLSNRLRRQSYPYAMYVIGDPQEMFNKDAVRHLLSPLFRLWFPQRLRAQCAHACAVAYVSKLVLRERYPPAAPDTYTTHFAIDGLRAEAYIDQPRPAKLASSSWELVYVGTLAQLYKAPDILIDAVAACVKLGLDLRLTIVGDGKHRGELEARVAAHGLSERVRFRGWLPGGKAVRDAMDQSDLFILPSRAEALGQVFVEAMARGLPCIGTTSGGIPEMLDPDDMVAPGDTAALIQKIRDVVSNPARMARMGARNLEKAREYSEEEIGKRRNTFYRHVRNKTEDWLRSQG